MPTYNSYIAASNAASLIPEEVSREIAQNAVQSSAILRLFRQVPMSTSEQRKPVLSTLPQAYFVSSPAGLKQTTNMSWTDKFLNAEEIAVIVPIEERVLADASFDIWGEVRPRLSEAFGRALDAAILFGTGAPSSWGDSLLHQITDAGNTVVHGTGRDVVDEIGGTSGIMAKVEAGGYDVSFFIGATATKAMLRGVRTSDGALIFQPEVAAGTPATLYGQPLEFPKNGAWDATQALLICGDRDAGLVGMRQDMTIKLLDQAAISDADGKVIINLAQQDMVALRATMRVAWVVPNPVTSLGVPAFPFAALLPAT